MSKLTFQQHDKQDTRVPVGQRRTAGGKVLEDNRAAFAAKQLKQGDTAQLTKEEDELLKGKSGTKQLAKKDEEEIGQAKFSDRGPPVQREQQPAKPNNTGLPDKLKIGIESLSGMSMDNVKVHYNSVKPQQLNALAYAQGTDIHVGPGQEKHLPHEAWHVVQQAQGRVKPTMQMKGGVQVNNDKGLEKEADAMGEKAVSAEVVQGKSIGSEHINDSTNLVTGRFNKRPAAHATQLQRMIEHKFESVTQQRNRRSIAEHYAQLQKALSLESSDTKQILTDEQTSDNEHIINKDQFLLLLKVRIRMVADESLSRIGQTSENCPYISKWFTYYAERSASQIEAAIKRYAPETSGAASVDEVLAALERRVKHGFEQHLHSGSLEGVPDDMKVAEPDHKSAENAGRPKTETIQRCCFGEDETEQERQPLVLDAPIYISVENECPRPGSQLPNLEKDWVRESTMLANKYPVYTRWVGTQVQVIATNESQVVASSYAHVKNEKWIKDFSSYPPFAGLGGIVIDQLRKQYGAHLQPEHPSLGAYHAYQSMGALNLAYTNKEAENAIKQRIRELVTEAKKIKSESNYDLTDETVRKALEDVQKKIKMYEQQLFLNSSFWRVMN